MSFSQWRPDPPKIRKIHPAGNRQIPVNFLLSKSDFFWPRGGGVTPGPRKCDSSTFSRFSAQNLANGRRHPKKKPTDSVPGGANCERVATFAPQTAKVREGCHFLNGARTLPKSEKSTPPETVDFLLTFCCPKAIFGGLVGGGHARPPEMRQFHVLTLLSPKPSKRPQTSEKNSHRQRPTRRKTARGLSYLQVNIQKHANGRRHPTIFRRELIKGITSIFDFRRMVRAKCAVCKNSKDSRDPLENENPQTAADIRPFFAES